ncbi:MAG: TMEM165/GDT1 family protein [Cyanobacteria bacterium P01_F01_bin.42]
MNIPHQFDSSSCGKVNSDQKIDDQKAQEQSWARGWFKEFFATFLTIFAAEFGDKTQLATLMIAAESHSPWVVFVGAGLALIATSLVGVLVGRWLSQTISERMLEIITGLSLVVIAGLLLWDLVRL